MKSVNIYIPLLLLLFSVGACGTKKSGGTSGTLTDEALLDTVQRRTFNYFWDGAEPNSGLARERIHMDGVYPENDRNVVTSGGSGFGIMAVLARYSRSSMLETLREDYVRTARAKGQKESMVMFAHAFRNSLIQVVTILGLQIGGLLSGSVLTETVFSIPGMGRLLTDSIQFRDYAVIQGLLMLFALQYVLINLIVDLLYGVINPKIRLD